MHQKLNNTSILARNYCYLTRNKSEPSINQSKNKKKEREKRGLSGKKKLQKNTNLTKEKIQQ